MNKCCETEKDVGTEGTELGAEPEGSNHMRAIKIFLCYLAYCLVPYRKDGSGTLMYSVLICAEVNGQRSRAPGDGLSLLLY